MFPSGKRENGKTELFNRKNSEKKPGKRKGKTIKPCKRRQTTNICPQWENGKTGKRNFLTLKIATKNETI